MTNTTPGNRHADCACGSASIYCHNTLADGMPQDRWRIECKLMACGFVSDWFPTLRRATNAWNRGKRHRRGST